MEEDQNKDEGYPWWFWALAAAGLGLAAVFFYLALRSKERKNQSEEGTQSEGVKQEAGSDGGGQQKTIELVRSNVESTGKPLQRGERSG